MILHVHGRPRSAYFTATATKHLRTSQHLVLETNLVEQSAALATYRRGLVVKDLEQALPDLSGFLAGIDGFPDARLLVVRHDGGRLLVVRAEALLEGVGVVVGSLDQRLARHVIRHVGLGWVEDLVVGAAGRWVHEAAGDTGDEERVIYLELDGVLERFLRLLQHFVELLRLGDGSWETIEDETAAQTLMSAMVHYTRAHTRRHNALERETRTLSGIPGCCRARS